MVHLHVVPVLIKQPLRLQTQNTFLFSASVVKLKASWDYSSHHSGLVWKLTYDNEGLYF